MTRDRTYIHLEIPKCPQCQKPLTMVEPGTWACQANRDCEYVETNNITRCAGKNGTCLRLILSSTEHFDSLEERYCSNNRVEGELTCLEEAKREQDEIHRTAEKICPECRGEIRDIEGFPTCMECGLVIKDREPRLLHRMRMIHTKKDLRK